jgi:hypothetical protein
MRRLLDAWRRFFYTPGATAPLDQFRRYLAIWTGAWALIHLPHAEELYCRPILREGLADVWFGLPAPPLAFVLVLSAGLVAALVLVITGVRTRASTWAATSCFAALVVLDASELLAYNGLALLQWTIVAVAPDGPSAPRWATRLAMLQLSTVYGFAALSKLVEGPAWRDGSAITRILGSPRYGQHFASNLLPPMQGAWPVLLAWVGDRPRAVHCARPVAPSHPHGRRPGAGRPSRRHDADHACIVAVPRTDARAPRAILALAGGHVTWHVFRLQPVSKTSPRIGPGRGLMGRRNRSEPLFGSAQPNCRGWVGF